MDDFENQIDEFVKQFDGRVVEKITALKVAEYYPNKEDYAVYGTIGYTCKKFLEKVLIPLDLKLDERIIKAWFSFIERAAFEEGKDVAFREAVDLIERASAGDYGD